MTAARSFFRCVDNLGRTTSHRSTRRPQVPKLFNHGLRNRRDWPEVWKTLSEDVAGTAKITSKFSAVEGQATYSLGTHDRMLYCFHHGHRASQPSCSKRVALYDSFVGCPCSTSGFFVPPPLGRDRPTFLPELGHPLFRLFQPLRRQPPAPDLLATFQGACLSSTGRAWHLRDPTKSLGTKFCSTSSSRWVGGDVRRFYPFLPVVVLLLPLRCSG